jgi:hypothetical protein
MEPNPWKKLAVIQLRNSQHNTETEGSLPCSQQPATGLYLKPDESSPYHSILFFKDAL